MWWSKQVDMWAKDHQNTLNMQAHMHLGIQVHIYLTVQST